MEPLDYEKLGVFYLGRVHDLEAGETTPRPLLYDSRDLVTHAVCVGMTGSGKTGLCIDLLEEAVLDGVPAIAIDPKGDLGNMLLAFPDLGAADFRPWVLEEEAARKGVTADAYAAAQAELWRRGLADWDQDGERIRRFRDAAEFTIYTPGSTAGRPLSIVRSLAAPPAALREDPELLGDRIGTTVTGLLGLLGLDADPLQSREHILISTILQQTWSAGLDLDLAGLIRAIQDPPVRRVGVMDVEVFFPSRERHELALRINNLLASPGFATWLAGEPLDPGRLLFTEGGRPRLSIVSIAHLSDAERMFIVALLLNEVVGWIRAQPGTTSLRAIVYMDEIFGFFPPVAEPPSKRPLLTLLKQARAHGLGIVLATQNPVDLDYKGLANTGTWFLGRLQTERDKQRVLEGLEGATAGSGPAFDRSRMGEILAGLGKRIFLMHNVHESSPVVFETRWAMSYLRGPLTRAEIARLTPEAEPAVAEGGEADAAAGAAAGISAPRDVAGTGDRPLVPPAIEEVFVPATLDPPAGHLLHYEPALLVTGSFRIDERKWTETPTREIAVAAPLTAATMPVEWSSARVLALEAGDLTEDPQGKAGYGSLPPAAVEPKSYTAWKREFVEWVTQTQSLTMWRSPMLGEVSRPDEDERAFRIRLQQHARERRDTERGELEGKYGARAARLEERIRKAEQALAREEEQARQAKLQTVVSIGATVLGGLFGRRALGRATTAARGVGRSLDQAGDVGRAEENVAKLRQDYAALDAELRAEIEALGERIDPLSETLEAHTVRPEKDDVSTRLVALGWLPWWVDPGGARVPAREDLG
ncbi:MAG TPA: ATP-binding protein [Gemmatimonadota bacterium]|nr:ATP-binding protein [Gemmatimonadota bacterium]